MWAIIRKEWKSYFVTPAAYVVLALFAVIAGFFFYSMLAMFVMQSLGGGMMFGRGSLDAQTMLLQPFFFDVAILLLFLLPMVTMRSYAEEARNGTLELLKTAPVRRLEVVLGKFLAAFGLLILLLVITGLYVGLVAHYGKLGLSRSARASSDWPFWARHSLRWVSLFPASRATRLWLRSVPSAFSCCCGWRTGLHRTAAATLPSCFPIFPLPPISATSPRACWTQRTLFTISASSSADCF
jgi:hypothetical protein